MDVPAVIHDCSSLPDFIERRAHEQPRRFEYTVVFEAIDVGGRLQRALQDAERQMNDENRN